MRFEKLACWVFSGLMLAASGAYAQEAASQKTSSKPKATAKKTPVKEVTKKTTESKEAALKAQYEAEARAKAEQEARLRAEEEARKQAEAETRKRAEIEAREKPLREADALLNNGKPADAYALLEPLEFERAGEVRFDYLLGITALDSGKADKATLAFERVLAVDPNFAGARLDMARAYYQLGDLQRAETEFNEVMKQNPPEAARITIQKYLNAIIAYEQAKQTRISGYVEGVVGHDSNVNTGTGSSIDFSSISPMWAAVMTGLIGVPPPPIPPSQLRDNYLGFAAGGEISHNLNANWGVFAGADLRQHGNMVQTPYDSLSTDGRVGVMYAEEKNAYKLSLTGGQSYSANSMRRDSLGVNAEWQHVFSPANQMSVFVQYGENRAAGTPPTSPITDARIEGNANQVVVGAGWVHILADGKQALFGSVYAGTELDVAPVILANPPLTAGPANGGRLDGKKRFEGLRIGGQAAITDQIDGVASLGWQHAKYRWGSGLNPSGERRNEYQYDLTAGANWRLGKLWTVKPQLAFSKKSSNVVLYKFDRTDVSLTIRRDFK